MAVGRISGPLLKANLLRNGVDLAFETDLLYLDVNNLRIGIKTNNPSHDLQVNGTTRTTNLETTTQLDIGNITISGNTIASSSSELFLNPTGGLEPVVYQKKIVVDELDIANNSVTINTADTDLELAANGTGEVKIFSNTLVNGNLHATGTITADGNLTLGDGDTDSIVFNADIGSNILPNASLTYNLGNTSKRWNETWVNQVVANQIIVSGSLLLDGVDLTLRPGNILYVSKNGNDTRTGTHQNDPLLTVKRALTVATAGTTILIYPGVYSEIFPLTIPAGVTVRGQGIRSVTIQPTAGTISNDAFLLNGETTVEELTITGFRYNSGANTGHAFRFAPNYSVTSRSPYVRNVTVITSGSVITATDVRGFNQGDAGRGGYFDGSIALSSSNEVGMLFHGATFITPGVDCITATNGVRIEWLNSFTYFANKGLVGLSGSTGFAGTGKTEIRLDGATGTFLPGDTLTYYSTYPTAITSGVISSVASDGKIYLTGKVTGLQTAQERGGKTITAHGDAKLSTVTKKWGSASLALDGTGDYATVPTDIDFAFGTGAWCIEAWVYNSTGIGATKTIFDFRPNATLGYYPLVNLQADGHLQFGANGLVLIDTGVVVPQNTWTHIAIACNGTSTKAFVNGTQAGATYTDNNTYAQGVLTIGARYDSTLGFPGFIDDVRITKGLGRYTSNFAAPTGILANDAYTVFLSRFDGSDNSTTFVDETFVSQDVRSSSGATANKITLVDHSDFGVELRSISSACVYGNYGAFGDGLGVTMYLVGHNMAYIGTAYRSDNDDTNVIQANEVVELDGAHIYYSSVDHKGDFRVGDLFYVNQEDGTVNFTSANFNIVSDQGLTFTNGSNTTYIDGNEIDTGNLRLSGNTLSSTVGEINLLSANDQINLLNNVTISGNLDVVGNVTIGGNIIIGDQTTDTISFVASIDSNLIPNVTNTYDIGTSSLYWKDLYANRALVGNITIQGTQVATTTTNSNLELVASGNGAITFESLSVQNNEISGSTNADIVLSPNGTGLVDINSNKSLKVPVGSESERPGTATAGMIRFNTTQNRYEGYNGTNWVFLDGLSDLDGNTKVTAELTPGANDNTVRIYTDGTQVVDIDSTRLNAVKVTVDDLEISGSTISNTTGGSITLQTGTLGSVSLENFVINGNSITNTVPNAVTTFNTTGTGYFRIVGQGGFVVPAGLPGFRPGTPVAGMVRFDTSLGRLEVYDGSDWVSAAGASTGVTKSEVEEIALQYAIALG